MEPEVDFNIVVSIPTTQNTGRGSKQVTLYLLVVEATSTSSSKTWQWKKVRRYSEFYGLYQQLKKIYPSVLKSVTFPPKKVFGRLNTSVIKERRALLEEFLGAVVENPEIINSDVHLRAFLEIDKTLSPIVMQEKNIRNENIFNEKMDDKPKYAKALYSFEARNEGELSIIAGEYFVISDTTDNNGWWEGQLRGEIGYFPKDYVEIVDDIPEDYEDEILYNDSTPELPDPMVPSKLNEETKIRRRTVLLSKLEADALKQVPQLPSSQPSRLRTGSVIPHVVGTALYSFQGENEFELKFKKGDTVVVYTIDQSTGWWQGKSGDSVGYFPGSYIILPAGAGDLLLALNGEDSQETSSADVPSDVVQPLGCINEEIATVLPTMKIELEPEISEEEKVEELQEVTATVTMTAVPEKVFGESKRNSIRLRGNSVSKSDRPLPTPPVKKVIQQVQQQDSLGFSRKCILCPCDTWAPSEFEKNFCVHCRHLARMHRTMSRIITKSPVS